MKEGSKPTVSVLMCVYNGEKYLHEAIQSILSQTFADFEFIIVNDGSKDKTEEIIFSFSDRRIKYIKNEINLRLQASLNKGLQNCTGKYIARMDADDISLPDRLYKQVHFLEKNEQIDVLGTAFNLIGSNGAYFETIIFPTEPVILKWALFFSNPMVHPSVMMRHSVISAAGGYNINIKHSEDYELWCRLNANSNFSNLSEVLLNLRKHESNASLDRNNLMQQTAKISSKALSTLLQKSVPEEPLLEYFSRNQLIKSGNHQKIKSLMLKSYYTIAGKYHLQNFDVHVLKKYVAEQLLDLTNYAGKGTKGYLLCELFLFNPSFFFSRLLKKYQRLSNSENKV